MNNLGLPTRFQECAAIVLGRFVPTAPFRWNAAVRTIIRREERAIPISYEIDKQRRLVVCTATGTCTADDVLGCNHQMMSDSDFDPSFCQLVDGTGITSTGITPSTMRPLAEKSPFSLTSKRAFVADSPLGFALSRVYEIARGLRGDKRIRVFHNRADALEWLLEQEQEREPAA